MIDADRLAREAVEPGTPALQEIADRFGPDVIAADGTLNRPALGAIIFSDASAREALNEITHPAIGRLGAERIAQATAADPKAVVVYDIPLLVEGNSNNRPFDFQLIVVVAAEAETRIDRMVTTRGLTRQEAEHRLASQATDAERLAVADIVIDNNGTLAETMQAADELWQTIKSRG